MTVDIPETNDINIMYRTLCGVLLVHGTNLNGTRELTNVKIQIDADAPNIISCRDISLPYLFAEMTWYLSGSQSMKFISKFGSLWGRISDDGETSNSAYGHIIKERYGFDQLEKIVELLTKDPFTRRAVININIPNEHVIETKDEPCTICLQFMLRDGKLHCTGVMRSNDIWFGLPYDIVFFTEVQRYIARRLEVGVGTYTHFVMSLHAYVKDFDKVKAVISKDYYEQIHADFRPLWYWASKIYEEVDASDDPKGEIMRQFEKYGIYKGERR